VQVVDEAAQQELELGGAADTVDEEAQKEKNGRTE
jgi:hypothetical protein